MHKKVNNTSREIQMRKEEKVTLLVLVVSHIALYVIEFYEIVDKYARRKKLQTQNAQIALTRSKVYENALQNSNSESIFI